VACFSDLPSAGVVWGVGLLGFGDGGVFRFGKKHFGAAYHLRDECHTFNICGVTACSE